MRGERRYAFRAKPKPGSPIEVQVMGERFLDIFEARDISTTGVGINVPYRFEGCDLRNPVELVITLPGGEPFLVKGRIVHRSKLDREFLGVEFTNLGKMERAQIARYVSDRLWPRDAGS